MAGNVIRAIGHVALRVPDVEACARAAVGIMGLTETDHSADGAYLSSRRAHHELHYLRGPVAACDHVGLEADDDEALAEVRRRLAAHGIPELGDPPDPLLRDSVRFVVPGGFVFEVYVGMRSGPSPRAHYASQATAGVRPNRFGHVTFAVPDPEALRDVLLTVLDFRVSDTVGGGFFLRCNADHHGIGVMPGTGLLHHQAWEVQSLVDLGRLGDRVHEAGGHLLWGPVRHGVGNNMAAYFLDPAGNLIEYYTDMQQITDDAEYEPLAWGDDWYSMWTLDRPAAFAAVRGVPPRER